MYCLRLSLLLVLVFFVSPVIVIAQQWGPPNSIENYWGKGGQIGEYMSMAIVNGNPAIAFYDRSHGNLLYMRANDANGNTWGSPIVVDDDGNVGGFTSLKVVNVYPAISYYDIMNKDLKYVNATNTDGTAWAAPQALDKAFDVGMNSCLTVIDGNPAISYNDKTNNKILYIRATNSNGTAWGNAQVVSPSSFIWSNTNSSLIDLNGKPAIAFTDTVGSRGYASLKGKMQMELLGILYDRLIVQRTMHHT